jgi:hypothetical protein
MMRLPGRAARALAVGGVQVALALSVAGTYLHDRVTLPRAWVRTVPVDPNVPLRGRYVRLWLAVVADGLPGGAAGGWQSVRLSVRGDELVAQSAAGRRTANSVRYDERTGTWVLTDPVAFFIPEHAPDPSARAAGEELWAEVSVPRSGPPRPVRLGVRRNGGAIAPLTLR